MQHKILADITVLKLKIKVEHHLRLNIFLHCKLHVKPQKKEQFLGYGGHISGNRLFQEIRQNMKNYECLKSSGYALR